MRSGDKEPNSSFRGPRAARQPGIHEHRPRPYASLLRMRGRVKEGEYRHRVRRCAAPQNDPGTSSAASLVGVVIAALATSATPAEAHGFGQRYDLPLPLSFYLFGTAAAVVLSFVVVAIFARHAPGARDYPRIDLSATAVERWLIRPFLLPLLRLISVGLFIVTIAAGFIGNEDPYRNLAPTLVWIIFWVGLTPFSAFIGNIWAPINPWRTLFDAADHAYRAITGRTGLALRLRYPERLGAWPAVILLLAVSWTELVFPSPASPINIAWLALSYSLLTWVGMVLFGSEVWVSRGEVFAVFFGLKLCRHVF